jgi:hypothetical protein
MTGSLTLPAEGEKNTLADPKVLALLKQYNELLNSSNKILDTSLASPSNAAYRTLHAMACFQLSASANTYIMAVNNGTPVVSGADLVSGSSLNPPLIFDFNKADYEVGDKTQKLCIRVQLGTNATAPGITYTFGLYPVSAMGGATSTVTMTLGMVVSGSTVAFASPSSSALTRKSSGDFTIPSDGAYVLGFVASGSPAANARTLLSAQIQTRSV